MSDYMFETFTSTAAVVFSVVYDFAGIKGGRSTGPMTNFADANRMAMKVASEKGKRARVYARACVKTSKTSSYLIGNLPTLVAEYAPVNGKAECVPLDSSNGESFLA